MSDFLAFLIALILSALQIVTGNEVVYQSSEPAPMEKVLPAESLPEPKPTAPLPTPKAIAPSPTPPSPTFPEAEVKEESRVALLPSSKEFPSALEEEVFVRTNVERVKLGLEPLKEDSALALISRKHSLDMLIEEYFNHEDENNCNSACRAKEAEYKYQALGENIFLMKGFGLSAEDAAALIVQGWMGSPGHRANILREYNTHSGVGVAVDGGVIYATAMYSLPR